MDEKMKEMTIQEFIDYTKANPLKYINYCELIIIPNGKVIIPFFTCHVDMCIKYIMDTTGKTKEEIMSEQAVIEELPIDYLVGKYRLVAVWHSGYLYPRKGLTRFQKRTLDILIKNGLLVSYEEMHIEKTSY